MCLVVSSIQCSVYIVECPVCVFSIANFQCQRPGLVSTAKSLAFSLQCPVCSVYCLVSSVQGLFLFNVHFPVCSA